MAALYVFPDTNLLIHFKRLDQVDWPKITDAPEVVIVLAPVVIEELDDLKNRQESRKIKQRARDVNSWIRERWRNPDRTLRPGVTLEFAVAEGDEFLTGGLLARVKDDRLIATALSYEATGKDTALASNDTNPLVKAEMRGLRAIEPPADLALPLERDEVEKERDELKRERDELRSRAPKLEVAWAEGADIFDVNIPSFVGLLTPAELVRDKPLMKKRGERNRDGFAGIARYPAIGVPNSSVEAYNAALQQFHAKYEHAYHAAVEALDFNRRLFDLNLVLKNVGGASASHVMIRVDLPVGLVASDEFEPRDVPEFPKAPEPPGAFGLEAPKHLSFVNMESVYRSLVPDIPDLTAFDPYAPRIEDGGRRATWHENRLLHGDHEELRPLSCLVAAELIGRTVDIRLAIHCEELMRPIEQVLQISFVGLDAPE